MDAPGAIQHIIIVGIEQRVISSEFEKNGRPNSKGLRWHKSLPGACGDGTYVGRVGWTVVLEAPLLMVH